MVENFVPEIMEPYINEILGISARFITYDPYADDDDQDGEGSDMDEDEDDYEDSDIDEDYDDDDDSSGLSWKLRRDSPKLVSTILQNYPQSLIQIYKVTFEPLIKQLKDTNNHVVTELLRTLTKIFSFSAKEGPYYSLKSFALLTDIATGRRGSDVSMVAEDDPFAILIGKSESINQTFDKLLVTKNSTMLPLFYEFVIELSNAMEGLEGNWMESFTNKLHELKDSNAVTSNQIKFYSSVLKKNSLDHFGSAFDIVLGDILTCFTTSKNHELLLHSRKLLVMDWSPKLPENHIHWRLDKDLLFACPTCF
ncbi:unnamed protein product [Ambrosiozyma monospora]|uniref:Unnamed protein product n=1 Tax=Ambrosiozyma monospora TaxID=43982 RepID=A0A9W6T0C7_AMBMO|nr:unnamed protein product [Ambrosiozyma monospora]